MIRPRRGPSGDRPVARRRASGSRLVTAALLLLLLACGADDEESTDPSANATDGCALDGSDASVVADVRAGSGGGSGEVDLSWPVSGPACFEVLRSAAGSDEIVAVAIDVDGAQVIGYESVEGAQFDVQIVDGRVSVLERLGDGGLECGSPCAVTYRVVAVDGDGTRSDPSEPACAAPPTLDAEACP